MNINPQLASGVGCATSPYRCLGTWSSGEGGAACVCALASLAREAHSPQQVPEPADEDKEEPEPEEVEVNTQPDEEPGQ